MQLDHLKQYNGIYFDPQTGRTYLSDGSDTGFTFERATWTGPFGLQFSWPWLNPISFATRETAARVVGFVRSAVPRHLEVTIDERNRIVGPFTRTPERLILVRNGETGEHFSAGLLAASLIRYGEQRTRESLLAELRQAGLVA